MFKQSFTLQQHTPIIHFQHDQVGATLRATEVKPKLDKYLIEHAYGNDEDQYEEVKIGGPNGAHPALDYKLFIRPSGPIRQNTAIPRNDKNTPMFFGNMGDEYIHNPKGLKQYKEARIEVSSFHSSLVETIATHIAAFFAQTNFGMRQSKGYGSFTVGTAYEFPAEFYRFTRNEGDVTVVMNTIDLFYKSLRGGINAHGRNRDSNELEPYFYMKPMLFLYAKENNIQWEKKTIKEQIFQEDLLGQQGKPKNNENIKREDRQEWPLWYGHEDKKIVRDVLGLSTQQRWRSYGRGNGASITKEHVDQEGNPFGKKDAIIRFKSPLFFKPVFDKKGETVTIYFRPEPLSKTDIRKYLDAQFLIEVDGTPLETPLPMWDQFDLRAFLDFAFKPGRLKGAMKYNPNDRDRRGKKMAETLLSIYKNILKNQ